MLIELDRESRHNEVLDPHQRVRSPHVCQSPRATGVSVRQGPEGTSQKLKFKHARLGKRGDVVKHEAQVICAEKKG